MRTDKQQKSMQDIRPITTTYYRPSAPASATNLAAGAPQSGKKPKKRFRWLKVVTIVCVVSSLIITILLGTLVAMNAKNVASASKKLFGTSNVFDALPPQQLTGTADGTVHFLIAGYSADDPGHGGAMLTDSIMVVGVNKATGKGYMLNIPRDLYVQIPGHGSAKINEAYQDGERDGFDEPGYPTGGMGLLTKVVETVTGLDVPYYFLVNYAAVREVVDALGGITVTINSPDQRGIYDPGFKPAEGGPLQLPNGASQIDGQTALKLTRARGLSTASYGFPESDFSRAEHQQAVLVGILNEISWRTILNPKQNQPLLNAVANNVQTNLVMAETIPLLQLFLKITPSQLANYTLKTINGQDYLHSYTTPSGQAALVPIAGTYDYSAIQAALQRIEADIAP